MLSYTDPPSEPRGTESLTGRLHLLYLGLLPSLATFAVVRTYGYPLPFLLFFVGVGAVGIYLAAVYSYTRLSASPMANLLALLDGPLFVLVAQRMSLAHPLGFAVEGYLVDGLSVWLSILLLATISSRPTTAQRVASIIIISAILGVTASLAWPYVRDVLYGHWVSLGWLGLGLVEATLVQTRLFDSESTVRPVDDGSILYIALLVMVWVGAISAGLVLHETG
jgi:hypothetical protein